MTTKTTELYTTFEAEAERQSAGYLTGRIGRTESESIHRQCEAHGLWGGVVVIDWYTTRGTDRTPTIRVKWDEPSYASRRVIRNGSYIRTKTWATVERQQLFPFTAEGFDAAVKFAESI